MSSNKLAKLLRQHNKNLELLKELKIAYASAMWSWARIDSDIFSVYIAAIDGFMANFLATQKSYFSVVSAQARLDITHQAALSRWANSPLLARWIKLQKTCKSELAARGRIAHLTGSIFEPEMPHQKHIAILEEHFWHPNKKLKYNEAKSVGFTADQLIELSKKWDDLHRQLRQFYEPIWTERLETLSPKTPEQPMGLLRPQTISPQTKDRKVQRKRRSPSPE